MKIFLVALLAIGFSTPGSAQLWSKKKGKKGTTTAATEKKKDISAITKSCKSYPGLFAIYQDTTSGELYLKINSNQLQKEYIYFSQVNSGSAPSGYFKGSYQGSKIFKVEKYFDRIEFVIENTRYYYDSTNAISKVANANINRPVVISEKIAAQDSTGYLIKANEVFLGEGFNQVKPSARSGASNDFNLGSINKDRSKVLQIKNYPANSDVSVSIAFVNPYPTNRGDESTTDARQVNIEIYHSLIEMPQNDFQPRQDDPRIGYFMTQRDNMTDLSAKPYKDMIHRWHLVKKNPELEMSEPIEPITWWVENTTPVEFRETIRQGVLRWNRVFEKAGFINAVDVQIQPDDADWDAGDIRYNVLRWTASPTPRFGGYGPSFVNPRTGQILGADIMLEYVYFKNILNRLDRFDRAGMEWLDTDNHSISFDHCAAGSMMQSQLIVGMATIKAGNFSQRDSIDLVRQALTRLVLHEVGHTLGLNHNMKASSVFSPAELKDKSRLKDGWLGNSIMEYPAINNTLNPADQTLFYDEYCGPYDEWAIEFGYSSGLPNEAEENQRLQKILARSADPMLAFGNDADDMRTNGNGIDPRVNIYDLSSDPVAYAAERIVLVNTILPTLKNKYSKSGDNYHELRTSYLALTAEVAAQLKIITRPIGGVYVDRAFVGTERPGTKPYQPVPYALQKEAMRQLRLHAFGVNAFKEPTELYNFLQQQRRGFGFGGNNEDPHIHSRIMAIHSDLFNQLLHENVLERITDATLYGNQYKLDEYFTDLTASIIDEDLGGKVGTIRQNTQVLYVQSLLKVVESSKYDPISKGNALYQLQQIKRKMGSASTADGLTRAHRSHIQYIIETGLDKKK